MRLIAGPSADDAEGIAFAWQPDGLLTHVSSNSWGPSDDGKSAGRLSVLAAAGQETDNRKILSQKAKILEVKEKSGQINLRDMLKKLAQLGVTNILVEGGGTLIGALFDEGFVDRVLFFISPKVIGGKEAISSVMGRGISRLESARKIKDVKLRRLGEDFLIEGYVR